MLVLLDRSSLQILDKNCSPLTEVTQHWNTLESLNQHIEEINFSEVSHSSCPLWRLSFSLDFVIMFPFQNHDRKEKKKGEKSQREEDRLAKGRRVRLSMDTKENLKQGWESAKRRSRREITGKREGGNVDRRTMDRKKSREKHTVPSLKSNLTARRGGVFGCCLVERLTQTACFDVAERVLCNCTHQDMSPGDWLAIPNWP